MNKVVIDIGFGDSGKGITTDYKVRSTPNPIVCRFSGGQNSGHTVMLPDGRKHTFSQFGSGTMRNIPTYWSKYCTTYPIGLMNELDVLKDLGLNPVIYIDKDSPITTPYEIYKNVSEDKINGHGTCGVGTTFEREENFRHLTFSDLLNRTVYDITSK
jgi:adenylosuccinate synthase